MAKEPFLPLFFGDFLASTSEWEGEERGLYLLLLGYEWSLGSLPAEPRRLCKLVGWDWNLFEQCWQRVGTKFVPDGERLRNARLEAHRTKAAQIAARNAQAGRRGAQARWGRDANEDGGRHFNDGGAAANLLADATKFNGVRHIPTIADAIKTDDARHKSANGGAIGFAIASNPIQSNPSNPDPPERTSQDSHTMPPSARAGVSVIAGGDAWRDVGCDPEAYESWLRYRDEAGDSVPASVRIEHAKWLRAKGTADQQRTIIAELVRLQFKRLHDPFHPTSGAGPSSAEPAKRTWRPDPKDDVPQREDAC
ncbi:MAG: hypothetical protein ACREUT_15520 [Steroidobacteraceae bacterium]